MNTPVLHQLRPTGVYVGGSYIALGAGALAYLIGLWNSEMAMSEKGFYFIVLLFGLFSAVSLQKTVRDRLEGLSVTGTYLGLCYIAFGAAVLLLTVGLWNANMTLSEKGFYGMSFVLALFSAITVQKNTRDLQAWRKAFPQAADPDEPPTAA